MTIKASSSTTPPPPKPGKDREFTDREKRGLAISAKRTELIRLLPMCPITLSDVMTPEEKEEIGFETAREDLIERLVEAQIDWCACMASAMVSSYPRDNKNIISDFEDQFDRATQVSRAFKRRGELGL